MACFFFSYFQVCDEPHPNYVKNLLTHCGKSEFDEAYEILSYLWDLGYSPEDIITTIMRVCKNHDMPEFMKLDFVKEIGLAHMKIIEGNGSLLQMAGLLARLCKVANPE